MQLVHLFLAYLKSLHDQQGALIRESDYRELSVRHARWVLAMALLSLSLLFGCRERDRSDPPEADPDAFAARETAEQQESDPQKPGPLDLPLTRARLGSARVWIPDGWQVRAHDRVDKFYVAPPSHEGRQVASLQYQYGIRLRRGQDMCELWQQFYGERLEIREVREKHDWGLGCAAEVDFHLADEGNYRGMMFAARERVVGTRDRGTQVLLFDAPIAEYARLGARRLAVLAMFDGLEPDDVARDGMVSKMASGAVVAGDAPGGMRLRQPIGWPLIPDGWRMEFDPFRSTRVLQPAFYAEPNMRFMASVLPSALRGRTRELELRGALSQAVELQGLERVRIEEMKRYRCRHVFCESALGSASAQGMPVRFVALLRGTTIWMLASEPADFDAHHGLWLSASLMRGSLAPLSQDEHSVHALQQMLGYDTQATARHKQRRTRNSGSALMRSQEVLWKASAQQRAAQTVTSIALGGY